MSHKAMIWLDRVADKGAIKEALNRNRDGSRRDKPPHSHLAVLWYLAWRYNDKYRCAYPKVGTIAADTGLSRATVQRALRDLEELGWIRRKFRPDANSQYGLPRFEQWLADGARMPSDEEDETPHGEAPTPQGEATPPQGERERPHSEAQNNKNQTERGTTSVKALRAQSRIIAHPSAPITEAQLAWLADIYLMTNKQPWTPDEHADNASMTMAEADEAIKTRWADVVSEGKQHIAERLPRPHIPLLSERALAWLYGTRAEEVA